MRCEFANIGATATNITVESECGDVGFKPENFGAMGENTKAKLEINYSGKADSDDPAIRIHYVSSTGVQGMKTLYLLPKALKYEKITVSDINHKEPSVRNELRL